MLKIIIYKFMCSTDFCLIKAVQTPQPVKNNFPILSIFSFYKSIDKMQC